MNKENIKKVVLAYSGGLDTSIIIPWLKENYDGCEVIAVAGNVGQADELDGLEERAKFCGAEKLYILDVIDEFCEEYIVPCVQAHAVYENKYLLGTSMARPLIAKKLVEIARKEGATTICHGATGKGNDQIRFEMGIKALAFWSIRRWRSDAPLSLASLRAMAPFSLRLLATDLIASVYNNVAQLFIGKIHNTSMLGYYSQAQKLKDLPVISTVQAVQGVTFPALSQIKDDDTKFSAGYLRISEMLAFVVFPLMLGMVAVAEDMFLLLLGDKWMPTVPYFEILALSGLFYPLGVVSYNVLKSRSDGAVIVRLEIVKRIIQTLILAVTIPMGVTAVAWGVTAMAAVEWLLNTATAMRYVSCGFATILRHVMPSLALAVAMYAVVRLSAPHLAMLHTALRLTLSVAIAVAFYLCGALLFRINALREALSLLRNLLRKSEH